MREKKMVVIPVEILDDPDLSPSEFYLIAQILRRQSGFDEITVAKLKPVLRLSENTIRCGLLTLAENGYLKRGSAKGTWLLNDLKFCTATPQNLNLNTSKIDAQDIKNCGQENEEERSKEEDKEHSQIDGSYIINNNIKENEKEREIPKRENDGPEAEKADRFTVEYREIIDYLNEKTGKKFSTRSRVNQGHMSARLKEGFTVEDFKRVIDIKCFQWKDDAKMAKFLRPETLFGTKFDRYLNEEKFVMREGLHGEKYVVTEEEMNSDCPF